MPRGRPAASTTPENAEGGPALKSFWKDRLTEDQLKRKRATDRQMVRKNRTRARQTIATLQERLDLLSSQQGEKVIADLVQTASNLQKDKDTIFDQLQAVYLALGIDREVSHGLMTKSLICGPEGLPQTIQAQSNTAEQPMISSRSFQATNELPKHDAGFDSPLDSDECEQGNLGVVDLKTELDSRMLVPHSDSPFPEICSAFVQPADEMGISDEGFLEGIIFWKQQTPWSLSVFDIASKLYHINRAPGYMTKTKLNLMVQNPDTISSIISDLNSYDPFLNTNPENLSTNAVLQAPATATTPYNISHARKELIICAFESIKPWAYRSKHARIVMFWTLYRTLALLMFPTQQNLAKGPSWFRPVPSQMCYSHPSFIDFIPWPTIRETLVHQWRDYQHRNLYSDFVENFDVQINEAVPSVCLLSISSSGSEVELDPSFGKWLNDLGCLRMRRPFVTRFPEFTGDVYIGEDELEDLCTFPSTVLEQRALTQCSSDSTGLDASHDAPQSVADNDSPSITGHQDQVNPSGNPSLKGNEARAEQILPTTNMLSSNPQCSTDNTFPYMDVSGIDFMSNMLNTAGSSEIDDVPSLTSQDSSDDAFMYMEGLELDLMDSMFTASTPSSRTQNRHAKVTEAVLGPDGSMNGQSKNNDDGSWMALSQNQPSPRGAQISTSSLLETLLRTQKHLDDRTQSSWQVMKTADWNFFTP